MKNLIPFILILIISNSCLEKNRQLERADLLSLHYLEAMIKREKSKVENLKKVLINVNKAVEISEMVILADTLLTVMSATREEMIKHCGGRDESFNLNEPYSADCVGNFFINMKYGEELRMHLSAFEDFLIVKNIDINRIALDANEIEAFKNYPDYKHHSFDEYNFGRISLSQTLVRLDIFELYIYSLQNEYLLKLSSM